MRTRSEYAIWLISLFFEFLFMYAAVAKILDFENFQVQLAQSPLLSAYAGLVSYSVIGVEVIITLMLMTKRSRIAGMYASLGLMSAFTVYIFVMLNFSDFVPCACGGILEKMGWTEHLIFNIFCVVLAFTAIITKKLKQGISLAYIAVNCMMVMVFSATVVIGLFLSSEHMMKKDNGFVRRFVPYPVYGLKAIDLKADTFYFAGNRGDTLYLGNAEAPLLMAEVTPEGTTVNFDTLKISDYKLPFKNVVLNVNFPYFSLSDGTVPVLFEGEFPDKMAKKVEIQKLYFSKIKMTLPGQYIFKTTLTENLQGAIGLLNTKTNTVQLHHEILEKQIDGLFDTDGDFQLDYKSNRFVYTYYYRNQYITSNFLLEDISRGKTIDTVNTAKVQVKKLSTGISKMNAPPVEVNEVQAVYGNKLYNVGKLQGRYESKNRWKEAKIVDVYNYGNHTYDYSFYVYHRKGHSMRSMLVTAQHFYILIGNELLQYQRRR